MCSQPIAAARIPPITSASSLVAARTGGDPLTSTTDALASMRLSSAPAIAAPAPVETRDIMASFRDLSVDQVDAADLSDARRVGDYAQAIISYNKEREVVKCPRGTSMTAQTDINEKFRAILVDWLVEVHLKFKLSPETLYLAVSIMDRFLEKKIISRTTLQLVGITSILLASKYEEIYAPAVRVPSPLLIVVCTVNIFDA
ncbi:MAG: hypothetical protein P4L40_11315 [Terracidiphilus sp.]|nr:hypothetical protein [Terracidiphilus sp.]